MFNKKMSDIEINDLLTKTKRLMTDDNQLKQYLIGKDYNKIMLLSMPFINNFDNKLLKIEALEHRIEIQEKAEAAKTTAMTTTTVASRTPPTVALRPPPRTPPTQREKCGTAIVIILIGLCFYLFNIFYLDKIEISFTTKNAADSLGGTFKKIENTCAIFPIPDKTCADVTYILQNAFTLSANNTLIITNPTDNKIEKRFKYILENTICNIKGDTCSTIFGFDSKFKEDKINTYSKNLIKDFPGIFLNSTIDHCLTNVKSISVPKNCVTNVTNDLQKFVNDNILDIKKLEVELKKLKAELANILEIPVGKRTFDVQTTRLPYLEERIKYLETTLSDLKLDGNAQEELRKVLYEIIDKIAEIMNYFLFEKFETPASTATVEEIEDGRRFKRRKSVSRKILSKKKSKRKSKSRSKSRRRLKKSVRRDRKK